MKLRLPVAPILAAIATFFLVVPLVALLVRAPWSRSAALLADPSLREAIRLSLITSVAAAALSLLLGAPLAWILARRRFRGRGLLRAVALLPLVLPPVVGGVALLLALGRNGVVGRVMTSLFGIQIFGTTTAVVLAEAFVALPLVVLTVESGLRSFDRRYEEVARSLGASPRRALWMVTVPLISPSLAAAAVLAWARALGEFGATITFAGNLPGSTRTLPLAIFVEMQHNVDGAIALSVILVIVSLGVLVALRERWLR